MTALLLALSLRLAPNPPSLDAFGSGPFTNLGHGDEQAWTNAIAHVWFGVACPLALSRWSGLRTWQAGAICGVLVVARETCWHGSTPGPEVRTDLLSGLLPIATVVAIDALVHR